MIEIEEKSSLIIEMLKGTWEEFKEKRELMSSPRMWTTTIKGRGS